MFRARSAWPKYAATNPTYAQLVQRPTANSTAERNMTNSTALHAEGLAAIQCTTVPSSAP